MDFQRLFKSATCFAEVKTDSPKLYKTATRFAEAKTDSPKFSKLFPEVKTDIPNLYSGFQLRWKSTESGFRHGNNGYVRGAISHVVFS